MAYLGNTAQNQNYVPAIDYFNGDGTTVAFTLSRPVAASAQVQVVVNNVAQNPGSAFTVLNSTITFTSAPSSGTGNIYVYYTSPNTQVIQPGQGTVGNTQMASGAALANIGAGGVTSTYLASGAARTNFGAGAVLQVVNATYNTYSNTSSTSFVASGLTATITPSSSTSKVLVFANMQGVSKGGVNTATGLALYKNGSSLLPFDDIAAYTGSTGNISTSGSVTYLDSPATTSATTYSVYIKVAFASGTTYWNNYTNTNGNSACTITLMEIAA